MKLRLSSSYDQPDNYESPDPDKSTPHLAGDVIDASGDEADRLLSLGAAVELTGDEDQTDHAGAHLDMVEAEHKDMLAEAKLLKDQPANVVELNDRRIREYDQVLRKARSRAGKAPAKAKAPAKPVPPSA